MSDVSTARHDIEENPTSIGAWTSRTQLTVPRKLANSSVEFRGLNNFLERWSAVVPPTSAKPFSTCRDPRVYTRARWLSSTQDVQPRKREPKELQEAVARRTSARRQNCTTTSSFGFTSTVLTMPRQGQQFGSKQGGVESVDFEETKSEDEEESRANVHTKD